MVFDNYPLSTTAKNDVISTHSGPSSGKILIRHGFFRECRWRIRLVTKLLQILELNYFNGRRWASSPSRELIGGDFDMYLAIPCGLETRIKPLFRELIDFQYELDFYPIKY